MRLVGESARKRDVAQAAIRGQHQALGVFQAAQRDEDMRRATDRLPKGPCEVRHAQLDHTSQYLEQQRVGQMGIDVFADFVDLPGCEATPEQTRRSLR
jgi:hypothetical protein